MTRASEPPMKWRRSGLNFCIMYAFTDVADLAQHGFRPGYGEETGKP
jgi:hypothetical protein